MSFEQGGRSITLRTGTDDQIRELGAKSIERLIKQGGRCFSIKIEPVKSNSIIDFGEHHNDIANLLNEFSAVMEEPQGLPPQRAFDHVIPLKEGSGPINVHPYRYANFQKIEIEQQVKEMLSKGLIRPSSSPFSSPVLLVKKKDGS